MIRPATIDDIDAIAFMEILLFPENCFNERTIANELSIGHAWVSGNPAIAYVIARVDHDLVDVMRLGVHPDFQSRGHGAELLAKTLALAPMAMLTVRKDNPRAIQFYRRFGFEIVGHFSGIDPAWAMRRAQPQPTASVP